MKPSSALPPVFLLRSALLLLFALLAARPMAFSCRAAEDPNPLVGRWSLDEGFQIVELMFRSDGRYRMDTRSTNPDLDFAFNEDGRYSLADGRLKLAPYEYFGDPAGRDYTVELAGAVLVLERAEFSIRDEYRFQPGSADAVLAGERVARDLIGTWRRPLAGSGTEEITFRPGGYYFSIRTVEGSQFPPEVIRGRYENEGAQLVLRPYASVPAIQEVDFFGTTLTFIEAGEFSGHSKSWEAVPGSGAVVRAKAVEAEAFLARPDWMVGEWVVRDAVRSIDVTVRPDGHYSARHNSEFSRGTVRGRYVLEPRRLHLAPHVGQDLYATSNGEFGKTGYSRNLDYYDGQLAFIDPTAISHDLAVVVAIQVPGSDAPVQAKVREAQAERARPDWMVGIWEVHDPSGWMEFTWRPDGRYIAKAGTERVPGQVERGRHVLTAEKLTLAPYLGLGAPRGFEIDLYDGDLFLIGDSRRLVVARKVSGSENEVVEKSTHPEALLGERGTILGLWSANRPGENVELTFRSDGQFRLERCASDVLSRDYGLFTVDMATRTAVIDSRFAPVQTRELDFYGDTLTLHGGTAGGASTYRVNLGQVDAAIAASHAADAAAEAIDDQWLARVPLRLRDPNATQIPVGNIPADPRPGRVFESPTVFQGYRLYRRLIPGFVYFEDRGTLRSVPVVNTREWHFFPTGRVCVRFTNHRAGVFYPQTVEDISLNWAAYRIDPPGDERDILHLYADNQVRIDTDLGEQIAMTLEDGRRHLFWEKEYLILSEWAAEQVAIPCQRPPGADGSLMNTGVSLSTAIPADPVEQPASAPVLTGIRLMAPGRLQVSGTNAVAGDIVLQGAANLGAPVYWQAVQTNTLPAGAFHLEVPVEAQAGFFRLIRAH